MPVNIDHNSRIFRLFISSLRSKHTKKAYVAALFDFMTFAEIATLNELIAMSRIELQEKLIDYVIERRKRLSYNSVNTRLAGLMKFCSMADIEINWKKVYSFLGEYSKTVKDRVYTREELRLVLQNADVRARVLVLLLSSTGIRIGAVPDLNIRHLQRWDSHGIYQFTVYERSREEYTTFCTPECAREIDAYLEYRKRFGENITPDSPLIRDNFDADDPRGAISPKRVTHEALRSNFSRHLVKAGLRSKADTRARKEVMILHSMRKYCNTQFIKAGLNSIIKEMLIGHSVKLDDAYFRPTDEDLLKEYAKAIPLLTLSDETRLSHQVSDLENKLTALKSVEYELARKDEESTELRSELAELRRIVFKLQAHIDGDLSSIVAANVEESMEKQSD